MTRSISLLSRIILHTWGIVVVVLGLVAIYYLIIADPLSPEFMQSPAVVHAGSLMADPGLKPSAIPDTGAGEKTGAFDRPATESANPDEWDERLKERLRSIEATVKLAEIRSYQNKMMVRELVRLLRAAAVVLVIIAVGFPFIVWLLSTKRILGLSGLSEEVAATLVVVEERQSKLAAILRDIQIEMDYLQSRPSPDLTAMMEQARQYLEQNEKDMAEIRGEKGTD